MEINDTLTMKGFGKIEVQHLDGSIETSYFTNVVTNAGKAQIALLGIDSSATPFTYMALGTSTTSPAASQTALGAEISTNNLGRAAATVTRVTTSQTNDTMQFSKTFTASGSSTVEEVGIFNASSSGTMLCRALSTSKPLVSGETITITYNVQFT